MSLPCQGEYAGALRSTTWSLEMLCVEVALETLGHRKSKNSKLLWIENWIHHWILQVKASSLVQEFPENVKICCPKIDLQISDLVLLVLVLVLVLVWIRISGPSQTLKFNFPAIRPPKNFAESIPGILEERRICQSRLQAKIPSIKKTLIFKLAQTEFCQFQ